VIPNPKRVFCNALELIGNTPLLRLNKVVPAGAAEVWVKLESMSPGFSVKDRTALGMVERAERSGELHPGDTIVEATAGNTGVGLALVGVQKGYRVVFFVPQKFSKEKIMLMEAFGAKVFRTPDSEGMEGAISRGRELAQSTPHHWFAAQFENPGNPDAHFETTGPELWEQMDGRLDGVVVGAGTAGTFTGIARYMKQHNPAVWCVLVESQASVFGGGTAGSHAVEGIGSSFIPATFDRSVCDEVISVRDEDAFRMVKELAVAEGILGGSSSGANVFAALQLARRLGAGKRVATLVPDSAERYLSKDIFNFQPETAVAGAKK